MAPRDIALVVASVAVLAAGVYLFREVNATPATADVAKRETKATPVTPPPAEDEPEKQPVASKEPDRVASARTISAPPTRDTGAAKPPEPAITSPDQVTEELAKPNPKLDAVMAEANKAYDRGEFDEAKGIALKVLAKDPTNVRMLRIVVSSACIDGDSGMAQQHYLTLPGPDREQMKIRCARYGITFNEK